MNADGDGPVPENEPTPPEGEPEEASVPVRTGAVADGPSAPWAPDDARPVPRLWASRRFPAALLGLVVAGGVGTLLAVVILTHVGHAPFPGFQGQVSRAFGRRGWDDTWVMLSCGAAVLIGLILLACGIVRGRASMLPLRRRPEMVCYIDRRAVEAMITDTAEHTAGTGAVNVNVRPRQVVVLASARYGDVDEVEHTLDEELSKRLGGVGLDAPLPLRVRLDRETRRVR